MPKVGGSVPAIAPDQAPNDPGVLRAKTIELILEDSETLKLRYENVGEETLHKGDYRGVKTRWREQELATSYRTTERRVAQSYEVQADGSLLVTTEIKAKKSKKRTYKQVFERPGTTAGAVPAEGG